MPIKKGSTMVKNLNIAQVKDFIKVLKRGIKRADRYPPTAEVVAWVESQKALVTKHEDYFLSLTTRKNGK